MILIFKAPSLRIRLNRTRWPGKKVLSPITVIPKESAFFCAWRIARAIVVGGMSPYTARWAYQATTESGSPKDIRGTRKKTAANIQRLLTVLAIVFQLWRTFIVSGSALQQFPIIVGLLFEFGRQNSTLFRRAA
jgi:hypothetical protein